MAHSHYHAFIPEDPDKESPAGVGLVKASHSGVLVVTVIDAGGRHAGVAMAPVEGAKLAHALLALLEGWPG